MTVRIKATIILTVLTSVLAFPSCTKDDGISRINVKVVKASTKSSVITTSSLEDAGTFVMDAIVDNDRDSFTSNVVNTPEDRNQWNLATEHFWTNGVTTRFWCWNSNAAAAGLGISPGSVGSDTRTFTYSMPAEASSRGDIILAYTEATWQEGDGDKAVNITFHHPLSNIRFSLHTEFPDNIEIESLTISNIYTQGTVTFNGSGFTWTGLNGWNSTGITDLWTKADISNELGNFFIVPQSTAAGSAPAEFTIHCRRSDSSTFDKTLVLEGILQQVWAPDTYYNYRLNVTDGPQVGIEFTIDLIDWGAETEKDLTDLL